MPNLSNIAYDKRIDALLRQEMIEHKAIISDHNKEVQILRDSVNHALERFNSLFEHTYQQLQEKTAVINESIALLQDKVKSLGITAIQHKETIVSLHLEHQESNQFYASKNDIENLKKDMASKIIEVDFSRMASIQKLEQEVKIQTRDMRGDFSNLKQNIDLRFSELESKLERSFSGSKIDKEGLLKEIRVYEKSLFIIEKKIENLYTLIDRLNKRGASCPKPE
jgi:Na+/phosphate symporter